ncbi:hypothetical protein [Kallotenue papyrolyticum]|uniref:hypothetical protein n=1 Tax=Kallotenue papyrolyticum TaxID=1325125 RepID=UPI000492B430|nr:hypothetical protein [Kallotenue papyrolyticum]
MNYRYATLLMVVFLAACGPRARPDRSASDASPTPARISASPGGVVPTALTTPTPATPTAAQPTPAGTTPPTPATPVSTAEQIVAWQGLLIPLPPNHRWETYPADQNTINGAPILAQGRIVFDRAQASPNSVELPDGVGFTVVQFSDSLDAWLALAQQSASPRNPIDPNTIAATEIAGQPALVYSHMVTGVGDRRTYLLKLSQDRLLIIDDTGYEQVIGGLRSAAP